MGVFVDADLGQRRPCRLPAEQWRRRQGRGGEGTWEREVPERGGRAKFFFFLLTQRQGFSDAFGGRWGRGDKG